MIGSLRKKQRMEEQPQYIVIEGNIGAGKSTLVRMLAAETGARVVLEEFADNPFLPKFYADPKKYGFQLELSFLAERYRQLNSHLKQPELFSPTTIADYYFVKSLIFARVTLADDEFALYRQLFDIIWQHIPLPTLYVYLHSSVERLMSNIAMRGREYEQSISPEYLTDIQQSYREYFKTADKFPIVVVDTTKLDFVRNLADYNYLKDIVLGRSYPKGVTYL
ncbi:MAG: deoxynucleoside kinase [Salinivirgaceae bacterium]|nr:deoxynucleoside kinase [Salinivirgaceae bacterium]